MNRIDLNADLGEGAGTDEALMPLITSTNVACGGHAGDERTMAATVALAQRYRVAVGAHPGFVDRENFGRRELALSGAAIESLVRAQILALRAHGPLVHVKPHGALYNQAARDPAVAAAVARAVRTVDPRLVLVGLAGSALLDAGRACGLQVASEGFVDRRYECDGSLTPRSHPGAVFERVEEAVAQALGLVRGSGVVARTGERVPLDVQTLCVHGDSPGAVTFLQQLRAALGAGGVVICPLHGEPR